MKKGIAILGTICLLGVLILPAISEAARTTTNCCQIRRTFSFNGKTWLSGRCYGEIGWEEGTAFDTTTDPTGCETPGGVVLCTASTSPAATPTNYEGVNVIKRNDWGAGCMLNTVYRISDFIFMILIVVAVIIGLAGGYNILTAGGDAEKVNKGRDLILYAIIGMVVAFFARAIPSIVSLLI